MTISWSSSGSAHFPDAVVRIPRVDPRFEVLGEVRCPGGFGIDALDLHRWRQRRDLSLATRSRVSRCSACAASGTSRLARRSSLTRTVMAGATGTAVVRGRRHG